MVYAAMLVECRSEEVVNITILADITLYERETAVILAQLISVVFVDVPKNDFGSSLGEKLNGGRSYTGCSA
jgi:hypothetical protein